MFTVSGTSLIINSAFGLDNKYRVYVHVTVEGIIANLLSRPQAEMINKRCTRNGKHKQYLTMNTIEMWYLAYQSAKQIIVELPKYGQNVV